MIFDSRLQRLCEALLLAIALVACASAPAPLASVPPEAAPADLAEYRLLPGDVIDVKVYEHPRLNETLKIRPDGFVSMQLLGEVRAIGSTPAELSEEIRRRLAERIPNGDAVVIVREYAAQVAYVGGEVAIPGPVSILGGMTLGQAVTLRGGTKNSARVGQVLLVRHGGESALVREIDLRKVFRGQASDVVLRPYDVVFIPSTRIARVGLFVEQYINSLVPRSLSFPVFLFRDGVTLW